MRFSLEQCRAIIRMAMTGSPVHYAAGRWITIGGKQGEDGQRHGGSPVYVEGGKITKGHPSLTGKKLDALDKESDDTHRQELARSRGHARATWAKKAKAKGIDPDHLHQLAGEIRDQSKAFTEDHNEMLAFARKALGEFGGAAKVLGASDRIEDASQIRGMDEVAESVAKRWPSYFSENEHASDTLFGMLREGNRDVMDEDEAYSQAFDVLGEHAATREREPGEDDPDEMPSWQGDMFGGFRQSVAKQKKMFDDSPLPKEPKDREDLPGQQMIPFAATARPYRYQAGRVDLVAAWQRVRARRAGR